MKNDALKLIVGVGLAIGLGGCQSTSLSRLPNPFSQTAAPVVYGPKRAPETVALPSSRVRFTDRVVANAHGERAPVMVQPVVQTAMRTAPVVREEDLGSVEPAAGGYPTAKPVTAAVEQVDHTVQPGETIYKIARMYNTRPQEPLTANRLGSSADVEEGMVLRVPAEMGRLTYAPDAYKTELMNRAVAKPVETIEPAAGRVPVAAPAVVQPVAASEQRVVTHTVAAGETMYRISRQYGASIIDILSANNLEKPEDLQAGMVLKIPAGAGTPQATVEKEPVVVVAPEVVPEPSHKVVKVDAESDLQATMQRGRVDPVAARAVGFAWPVKGDVVGRFGEQADGTQRTGINIQTPMNTPVLAAERGEVLYAGGGLKTYGKLVLIRHADGMVTAYAHNNDLLVKKGETVKKGQVVALSGASGNVDKPQLHFEVRKNARAVNPMGILAAR